MAIKPLVSLILVNLPSLLVVGISLNGWLGRFLTFTTFSVAKFATRVQILVIILIIVHDVLLFTCSISENLVVTITISKAKYSQSKSYSLSNLIMVSHNCVKGTFNLRTMFTRDFITTFGGGDCRTIF